MATRKTAPVGEYIPIDEAERMAQAAAGKALAAMPELEDFLEDQTDPDEIALENVLSELGSSGADAKVNVYQLDDKKNRAFVGSFLPGDFSIEQIQLQYGAGEYAVEVRKDKKWLKKTTVKIAAPRNNAIMAQPQIAQPQVETGKILETMQNGFKEMGAMFATALSGLAANQAKPKSSLETLQELQMMKEIIGGNTPIVHPPAADPLQMVELAMNLAEKIQPRTGEPGTGEVILEAIKNFAPLLGQAAQQRQQIASPTVPQLSHNPAPTMYPANPEPGPFNQPQNIQPTQPAQETDQMNFARKMYLNLLVSNAQADNDPTTYAQMLLDITGEQAALEFANAPDWFEKLCTEEPRAANFRAWFDELRMVVIELTKPENTGINGDNQANSGPAPAPDNVL